MKCPRCKSELVVSGQARLETLLEHVSCIEPLMKDNYVCSNKKCVTHEHNICWNSDGETYGGFGLLNADEFNAPYGSFERKLEVEVYKKGLKKRTLLPAWLMLWFLRPVIEHEYKADLDGNVLRKYYNFTTWASTFPWRLFKSNDEFSIHGIWWISTWKFLWRRYKENGVLEESYNRDFPYRAFEWFVKNIVENFKPKRAERNNSGSRAKPSTSSTSKTKKP